MLAWVALLSVWSRESTGAQVCDISGSSPLNMTVDPCLIVSPEGNIPFHVVVRNIVPEPVPNCQVTLEFVNCGFHHGSDPGPGIVVDDVNHTVTTTTDATGTATFLLAAGGTCPPNRVHVYAQGVLIASRSLASPDQDGNLVVDANDEAILEGKAATDPTGDLNCDHTTDASDVALLHSRIGHDCTHLPVGTRFMSHGGLRIRYR